MSGAKTHVHLFAPVFTAQPFSPRTVCLLKLTLSKPCMTVLRCIYLKFLGNFGDSAGASCLATEIPKQVCPRL